MRVLNFCEEFSPLSQTFIYDFIVESERQGTDNYVVTLRQENTSSRPFDKVETISPPSRRHPLRVWYRMLEKVGVREACLTGRLQTSYWPQVRTSLHEVARHLCPDAIHAHFGPAGVLIAPIAKELSIPLVVSFHGWDAHRLPKDAFWQPRLVALLADADLITAVSHQMRDHLIEIGGDPARTKVVHVGKKLEDYPFHPPGRDDSIRRWLTIGRMTAKKGHFDSIAAFNRITAKHPESTLHIIGDGPLCGQVKKYIKRNQLEERVHLLGEMSHDQVKHELTMADAFILCSKTAPDGDREGVPTVLMEAQAVGLPCVSTWHSGIPEVIPEKNQWLLAEEGNVTEIATRMERLVDISIEQLRRVVRRGRLKVEQDFNLTKEVEKARGLMTGLL